MASRPLGGGGDEVRRTTGSEQTEDLGVVGLEVGRHVHRPIIAGFQSPLRKSPDARRGVAPSTLLEDGRPLTDHAGHAALIRVAIIDDHPAIVASIAASVDADPGMVLAGTASTVDEAVVLLDGSRLPAIDVVLLDIQLDGGAEGLRLLTMLNDAGRAGGDHSRAGGASSFRASTSRP